MARNLSTNPGTDVVGSELERELDRLSVEQALRDFEIANARTIDVTQRLVDLSTEVRELRERLVSTQEALAASRAENHDIRSSATFRLAELSTKIRAAPAPVTADPPRTLVAVLVYGGPEFVPACIESLEGILVPGEVDGLVLDDCSPDAAWSATVREQCEASGVGYYRSPRNMGIPRNMNLALLHAADAGYDYVAITNSDVVFPSNLVSSMVSTAAGDPSIASVTAWSNHVSSFSLENVAPAATLGTRAGVDRVSGLLECHFRGRAVDIPVGVGFCMLLPVSMVDAVGLFDPIFGRGYCEEVDWCLRAAQFGYRNVLAPSAFVYHIGNATTKTVGVLEHWESSDPANEAIIDLRYPTYRDQLVAWDRVSTLDDLCAEAATELVLAGAREFGYVVEIAAIPRLERHEQARFVLSPDPAERTMFATRVASRRRCGSTVSPCSTSSSRGSGRCRRRSSCVTGALAALEFSDAAAARAVSVIDTYSYPQLAAPRGPAEVARPR